MNSLKALKYRLRPFVEEDLSAVVNLALRSTFPICAESLLTFSKQDPAGINVAELHSGEVVGVSAAINHSDKICFGGYLIVHDKFRNSKVGKSLVAASIQHAGHKNLGGNIYENRADYFKKLGFVVSEKSWTLVEHDYFGELRPHLLLDKLPERVQIESTDKTNFETMYLYDRALAGYDRKLILKYSSRERNSKTLIALKDGICIGYGMIKRNIFDAAFVGPLYADDARVAEVMLRKLLESMPDAKGLSMATVSANLAANEIVRKIGIPVHSNLVRVYTKENMVIDTSKIIALFDMDFSPL